MIARGGIWGVLALVLVSSFAAALPNPSGPSVPAAGVDAQLTAPFAWGGASGTANLVFPILLVFNETYDLTFTNVSGADLSLGYGFSSTTTGLRLFRPDGIAMGSPRATGTDDAHPGMFNVTFPSAKLGATGVWRLNDSNNLTVAFFFVQPAHDMTVSLTQNVFTYSTSAVSFGIHVTPLAPQQSAEIVSPGLIPPGATVTSSSPNYVFFGALPEANAFDVAAHRHDEATLSGAGIGATTQTDLPEHFGHEKLSVNPASLVVTPDGSTVRVGYSQPATWKLRFASGAHVLDNVPEDRLIIVGSDNSGVIEWSPSAATPPTFNGTTGTPGPNPGEWSFGPGRPIVHLDVDANHRFVFRPDTTWPTNSYAFYYSANTAGASPPEYEQGWWIIPDTPGDINLDAFFNGHAANDISVLGVGCTPATTNLDQNPACSPPGNPLEGPAGDYTLTLRISGANENDHPAALAAGDIVVSGDVLVEQLPAYDPASGIATFHHVVPLRAPGNIQIAVEWNANTASLTIPVTRGASATLDDDSLVAGETATVMVHVEDRFGNPVPDAQITIFHRPTGSAADLGGATSVNGTGAPGVGQNGNYALTFTPATAGDYFVYAKIGRIVGTNDLRAFSYAPLQVTNAPSPPVPELGTLVLTALGATLLVALARRR